MNKLLPYETIVKAHEGDPDAIDTILSHYACLLYTSPGRKLFGLFSCSPKLRLNCSRVLWYNLCE